MSYPEVVLESAPMTTPPSNSIAAIVVCKIKIFKMNGYTFNAKSNAHLSCLSFPRKQEPG